MKDYEYKQFPTERPPIYKPNSKKKDLQVSILGGGPYSNAMPVKTDLAPLIEDVDDLDLKSPKVMVASIEDGGLFSRKRGNTLLRHAIFLGTLLLLLLFVMLGIYCVWGLIRYGNDEQKTPVDEVMTSSGEKEEPYSPMYHVIDSVMTDKPDKIDYDNYYNYYDDNYDIEWGDNYDDTDDKDYVYPWEDWEDWNEWKDQSYEYDYDDENDVESAEDSYEYEYDDESAEKSAEDSYEYYTNYDDTEEVNDDDDDDSYEYNVDDYYDWYDYGVDYDDEDYDSWEARDRQWLVGDYEEVKEYYDDKNDDDSKKVYGLGHGIGAW